MGKGLWGIFITPIPPGSKRLLCWAIVLLALRPVRETEYVYGLASRAVGSWEGISCELGSCGGMPGGGSRSTYTYGLLEALTATEPTTGL